MKMIYCGRWRAYELSRVPSFALQLPFVSMTLSSLALHDFDQNLIAVAVESLTGHASLLGDVRRAEDNIPMDTCIIAIVLLAVLNTRQCADSARLQVRHSSGLEFWTRVIEGFTFLDLLVSCVQHFDLPVESSASLTLLDRRTGAPVPLDEPVLVHYKALHSSPQDLFLLDLVDPTFVAATQRHDAQAGQPLQYTGVDAVAAIPVSATGILSATDAPAAALSRGVSATDATHVAVVSDAAVARTALAPVLDSVEGE